ncbi:MAG: hypothetical protein RJA70_4023 [Pseudomonadota bacterium]|jgi:hypothetical protein
MNTTQSQPFFTTLAISIAGPLRRAVGPTALAVLSLSALACSGAPANAQGLGTVELALQTTTEGTTYELHDALFRIDGPESVELSGDTSSAADSVEQSLPPGQYTVELLDGWSLYRIDGTAEQRLDATLSSVNPAAFSIIPEGVTRVSYRFAVEAGGVDFEQGSLALSFGVDVHEPLQVYFSEVMKNPETIPDSSGEYLELSNAGMTEVDLMACTITRDTQSFEINEPLRIPAGGAVVLANSASPGFVPDYVYARITLPNTTSFQLSLTCNGKEVDALPFVVSAFPNAPGKSASLSGSVGSAAGNDLAGAWCDGVAAYAGDLGTPGELNASCN